MTGRGVVERLPFKLENLIDVSISSPVNGQTVVYENGQWVNQAGGGGAAIIGSSVTVTNPQLSGDATTGFYSAGAGLVDVAVSGTKVAEFGSQGLGILTGAPSASIMLDVGLGNNYNVRYQTGGGLGGGGLNGFVFCAYSNYYNTSNAIFNGSYIAAEQTGPCAGVQITSFGSRGTAAVALQVSNYVSAGSGVPFFNVLYADGGGVSVNTGNPSAQSLDVGGNALIRGSLLIDSTVTLVNGSTSGTATFYQPFSGTACSEVIVYCNALLGTATYTFPTAFTHTPAIMSTNGPPASVVTSLSTTAVTITGATTTGFIFIRGF